MILRIESVEAYSVDDCVIESRDDDAVQQRHTSLARGSCCDFIEISQLESRQSVAGQGLIMG